MGATTRDVPRTDWLRYLESVGVNHRGDRVRIEVISPDLGDQVIADGVPLQGISYETAGSEAGSILVEVGDRPGNFMVHRISRPRSVRLALLRPDGEPDIQIESEDGPTTLIRLDRYGELPA